jgi:hypothetical protein
VPVSDPAKASRPGSSCEPTSGVGVPQKAGRQPWLPICGVCFAAATASDDVWGSEVWVADVNPCRAGKVVVQSVGALHIGYPVSGLLLSAGPGRCQQSSRLAWRVNQQHSKAWLKLLPHQCQGRRTKPSHESPATRRSDQSTRRQARHEWQRAAATAGWAAPKPPRTSCSPVRTFAAFITAGMSPLT